MILGEWHRMISPSDLETRYAVEDGLAFMDSIFDTPSEESARRIERVKQLLDHLPPREADFLELYYFKKKKQTDIGAIFRVSQPTVHYRLNRAADRMNFMLKLPDIPREEALPLLTELFSNPEDIAILFGMWETTCQSEVAKRLGITQGKVRHRYLRALAILWEHLDIGSRKGLDEVEAYKKICSFNEHSEDPSLLGMVVELFEAIGQNLNLLRQVSRPPETQIFYAID